LPGWLLPLFLFEFVFWLTVAHKPWQSALLFALIPAAVGLIAWRVLGWLIFRFWSRH
jgi:hypothetical protein